MAILKRVSFKEKERALYESIQDEDFSSYVKKLIRIDKGLLPVSKLECMAHKQVLEIPKEQEQTETSSGYDLEAARDELEMQM